MLRGLLAPASAALALAAPSGATGNVLTVDASGGPGSQFSTIQAAVDAALPGDTILIGSGVYAAFNVDGKGLTVTADAGATVAYLGVAAVRNVPAGERMILSGLVSTAFQQQTALVVTDNGGAVWIQDCTLEGQGPSLFGSSSALEAARSSALVIANCSFGLKVPAPGGADGSPALDLRDCVVALHDSTAIGGAGAPGGAGGVAGGDGGAAVRVEGGAVFASGCALTGGVGGEGGFPEFVVPCGDGGDGAPALRLVAGTPAVTLRATSLSPGAGGPAFPGCAPGIAGPPTVVASGAVQQLQGEPRHHGSATPVRVGESVVLSFDGLVGDLVWWATSTTPALTLQFPVFAGAVLVGPPVTLIALGSVDARGDLDVEFVLPPLGPGVLPATLYGQGLFLSAAKGAVVSGGRATALIPAASG